MKKFEEEIIKNDGGFFAVHKDGKTTYEIQGLTSSPLIIFGDWVSPEDHQADIEKLKSQLEKQQPEIPEFVAEVFEDNAVFLTAEKMDIISWFNDRSSDREWDKVTLWARENQDKFIQYVMNRKPVEKQFYLKHIDFCKRDKDYDWYMIKHSDGPLNHLRVEKETLPPTVDTYFTQQEIDSMAADSYEKIEVEE